MNVPSPSLVPKPSPSPTPTPSPSPVLTPSPSPVLTPSPSPIPAPSPSPVPTPSPPPPMSTPIEPTASPSQSGGGLSSGAIAGIAAGGSVAVALLLLTWLLCKQCRAKGSTGGGGTSTDVDAKDLAEDCVLQGEGDGEQAPPQPGAPAGILLIRMAVVPLTQQITPFVESDAVAVFKDPYLDAPDDLVLRWARLALSCTAMPATSRPSMNQVLGELLKLKQEIFKPRVSKGVPSVDNEIQSSIGSSGFTAEMARAEREGMQSDSANSML
ncbi:unnamed protein product [Closterium sp. NIES-64]|nr:unnamed protein product [Closterium sp. NIES-64]